MALNSRAVYERIVYMKSVRFWVFLTSGWMFCNSAYFAGRYSHKWWSWFLWMLSVGGVAVISGIAGDK